MCFDSKEADVARMYLMAFCDYSLCTFVRELLRNFHNFLCDYLRANVGQCARPFLIVIYYAAASFTRAKIEISLVQLFWTFAQRNKSILWTWQNLTSDQKLGTVVTLRLYRYRSDKNSVAQPTLQIVHRTSLKTLRFVLSMKNGIFENHVRFKLKST